MRETPKYPQGEINSNPKHLLLAHRSHVILLQESSGLLLLFLSVNFNGKKCEQLYSCALPAL